MKHIEVVAAVITLNEKVLCVQRGLSKLDYISRKWEFPGGKIEANESQTEALIREINEELNLKIENLDFFMTVKHTYLDFVLTMHAFTCTTQNSHPTLMEHLDFVWLDLSQLEKLDWAAADIPIVKNIIARGLPKQNL
jgi:8-oxo-dGTP diphosphatase